MKDNKNFNIWLAGLIEGDGCIYTPETCDKKKKYPHIQIAFNKKDEELANKIVAILKSGYLSIDQNTIRITWNKKEYLLSLIERLNGHMRTPKILRLHKLIDWYKEENIIKKDLDLSPMGSNSWLSGMSDADSNFNIILTDRGNSYRVQRQWRLEISQKTYIGSDQYNWAQLTSAFINTNLLSRHRHLFAEKKLYSSYIIVAHNQESLKIIEDYFSTYPLYSSKFLDFNDWKKCGLNTEKNKENYDRVVFIKSGMNNKRTHFNWDHIN